MDLEQYQNTLGELANISVEKATEAAVIPAGIRMLASIKNRVIVDGKNSAGSNIGSYSTIPGYYTKEQFVKKGAFKPIGKNGTEKATLFNTTTQKGKKTAVTNDFRERKSMYLKHGYKELRDIQGRPTDKVNLFYSGDLMLSYQLQKTAEAALLGLTLEKSALIREGLEDKYGRVLYATKDEIQEYSNEVTATTNALTLEIFNA